jgi:ubiquinone/menaquinone biosynthesis C-methylase UbiE
MEEWVARGRESYDFIDLRCGSADCLPWEDDSFDIVHQAMLFSSVLDADLREVIAAEMRRVVRPDGYVLWYDFFFNPVNPDTIGMTLRRVRTLFPEWPMVDRARVTLAPPLSRVLQRVWCGGVKLLSRVRMLNFHYLILLQKPGTPQRKAPDATAAT